MEDHCKQYIAIVFNGLFCSLAFVVHNKLNIFHVAIIIPLVVQVDDFLQEPTKKFGGYRILHFEMLGGAFENAAT